MNAPSPSIPTSTRVLFLSRSESSVRTDVNALRSLAVTTLTQMHTSAEALSFLAEARVGTAADNREPASFAADIVICDEEMQDLPASAFLYAMAQNPALRDQPALVLSGSPAATGALRCAGIYVLERPYTQQDMVRMLLKAMAPVRRALRPDVFEAAAARKNLLLRAKEPTRPRPATVQGPMTTSDWLRKGLEHLAARDLDSAEYAFAQVLQRQCDHVEACLGLARVYRAKKDARAMYRALIRAAASYARGGEKERSEAITAVLPENMRRGLFSQEAIVLMEHDQYRQAALSFLDADKDSPGTPLHHIISRACLLMPRPEESMTRLCDAYEGMGHKATANALRRRLLAYDPYVEQGASSWLDKYPMLKEAVSVAGYAAWAWKQA